MKVHLHQSPKTYLNTWYKPAFLLIAGSVSLLGQDAADEGEIFELSPFTVDASEDMGYYASQSLAGGRLSTDIINTGTSIEVVTSDFMDDIGANDIQELLQYTTNTEVGGNLGNFVGMSVDAAQGDVSTQDAQRNPDANARIRGLARPDNTRDYFKTDIPFDQYNTERIDINRGSNSFLFGLGSPAGLINNQLSRAQFNDMTRIRFRVGSGGDQPSFRSEIDINREVLKDRLAVRVAAMMNRTEYRQEPNYRDDNRIYGTLTWHPFDNEKRTTIRAHWESGDTLTSSVSPVLPTSALDSWIKYRIPINVDYNMRYWRQQYGPSEADIENGLRFNPDDIAAIYAQGAYWPSYDNFGESDITNYTRPGIPVMETMNANGYSMIFDGLSGPNASMILQNQLQGAADLFYRGDGKWQKDKASGLFYYIAKTEDGDPWWSPYGNRTGGDPDMRIYGNSVNEPDRGLGWYKQGLTDLSLFDFTKYSLSGENDQLAIDFYNYNASIEHLMLDGKAGFELAYDFQNHVRQAFTSLSGTATQIAIDINKTIPLPQYDSAGNLVYPQYYQVGDESVSPNYWNTPVLDEDGLVVGGAMPNPNFGRPFVVSKTGMGWNRNDRQAMRFTGFYKLDFEDLSGDEGWLKWLGSHTISLLGDNSVEEYEYFGRTLRSFGADFDEGLHIGDASGTKATTAIRNVPRIAYIGPAVQSYLGDSVWDPNTPVSLSDLIIYPADYNMIIPDGYTQDITYWNKGADAPAITGDEYWAQGTFAPQWIPDEGVQIRHTEIKSWAVNAQSFFFNQHLVVNAGYREDYIESWLNKQVTKVGPDAIPDISPEAFRWQDVEPSEIDKGPEGSGTFGWGAVLHWPTNLIKLPAGTEIAFHYNTSENFVPDTSRLTISSDIEVIRLPSPMGESQDYGVTFQLFDRKFIVRLNWYENTLIGADSSLNDVFNQNAARMYAFYSKLNQKVVELDSSDNTINGTFDGQINADDIELERVYVYDDDGETVLSQETDAEVIAREWPFWNETYQARNDLWNVLQTGYWQIWQERNRINTFGDGAVDTEWVNGLTDLEDLKAEGFEASFTINPTRNLRMRLNIARQETVRSNIAPNLTRFIENDWLPFLIKYGDLDFSNPAGAVDGDTVSINANENLLKYFTTKAQEGFPSDEVREWRVNFISNYSFRDGFLDGFSIGASARWQSEAAVGYPLIDVEIPAIPGSLITIGDVQNPYMGDEEFSFDLKFGYSRKFNRKLNWDIQLNLRNLQNINSDELSIVTAQPDGSAARVRWDPPFQWQVTNTFRW